MPSGLRRRVTNPALARLIPEQQHEAFALHVGMPGFEVHLDPDITWMIQDGYAWSNAGVRLRFSAGNVGARLDEIADHYDRNRVGFGFWLDADATPADLETHLSARSLNVRKYFPGMAADLDRIADPGPPLPGLAIRPIADYSVFRRDEHPAHGRITTPRRLHRLNAAEALTRRYPNKVFDFVATDEKGVPLGAMTLFLGAAAAGFHDVGVIEPARRRGVARALLVHVMGFARDRGARHAVLLSTGMGESVYHRVGFREVCRIAYWYRSPWAVKGMKAGSALPSP